MEPPLISVVIVSYNYARYITTAIESVLGQDDPNLELIVVDNRSTDASWEIINRYAAADRRLRAYQNDTNLGITGNHNSGLAKARGEFLIFLSADDFFLPGHLTTLRAIRAEHPECDIAYTTAIRCHEWGQPFDQRLVMGEPSVDTAAPRNEFGKLVSGCFMCLPTMLIPKRYFDELGPFDENIPVASDWDMSLRMARAGARYATRRIPTVGVRFHQPQASGYMNYYSTGADIRETLYLHERFVTLENAPLLRVEASHIRIELDKKIVSFDQNIGANALPQTDRARAKAIAETLLEIEQTGPFDRGATPRVAVVMPTTGRFPLLIEALASLAAQTYTNWHAYVLRDFGADFSAVVANIPGLDGKWSYIDARPRRGPAGIRTLAMTLIDGDFVAYLDEDNTWTPEHLELAIAMLRSSGKKAVFSCSRLSIDALENGVRRPLAQNADLFRADLDIRGQVIGNSLPLNAVVHDRILYEHVGSFDPAFDILEDWEFLMRLESFAGFAMVPQITVDVHAHLGAAGQWGFDRIATYPTYLERFYETVRINDSTLLERRNAQRELAQRLVTQAPDLATTPQGIFHIYSVLTGALALRESLA